MTRLNLLLDQKAILTAKKEVLENKRGDIYVREQKAISDALLPFFAELVAYVEVQRGTVVFKMDHPELSYKKELFSLYLREDWSQDDNISFKGVDLSYYTTSTKGDDKWELRRLQLLGEVAEILENSQSWIVNAANAATLPFKAEYKEVYAQMDEIGKELRVVEDLIKVVLKEKIEFDLKNDGVEFDVARHIQLKFNYTPNVKLIKLIDFSKSGKKATAVFTFAHGDHTSREENINVSSIIDQVYGLRQSIVQRTLAE